MKKLFLTFILIIFSFSLTAQDSDIDSMLNSQDIIQKKLGLKYAQKDNKYEEKVIEIFKSDTENPEVRMFAARVLGVYKDDNSLTALLSVLKSVTDESIQASIINALSKFEDDKAVEAVIDILRNGKTEYIRSVAVQTLKFVNKDKVVDALIESLDDDSPLVRKKIVIALGDMGNKKAIPELQKVVKIDENEDVKANAQSSLYKLGVKNKNLKSTSTALILGVVPVNGLGLWYSDKKMLAITDLTLQLVSIGMMYYGYSGFNDMDRNNQLIDPAKHYSFIGGATIFLLGYVLDIVMPVMSVSEQNQAENAKTVFIPTFFTNGETTVFGFSFNF